MVIIEPDTPLNDADHVGSFFDSKEGIQRTLIVKQKYSGLVRSERKALGVYFFHRGPGNNIKTRPKYTPLGV